MSIWLKMFSTQSVEENNLHSDLVIHMFIIVSLLKFFHHGNIYHSASTEDIFCSHSVCVFVCLCVIPATSLWSVS